MNISLFNDALDDSPDKAEIDGFEGYDGVSEPTKLLPSIVRAGLNMWAEAALLMQTRPGLQFNTQLASGASTPPRGFGYYDTPEIERTLSAHDGKLFETVNAGNNAVSNILTGPTVDTSREVYFSQLVDRMFWCDGGLRWSWYNLGAWTHGSVSTFADASAMPVFKLICSVSFRILAVAADGRTVYASAVGQASANTDWVKTENFRPGNGTGDPIKNLIPAQNGLVYIICERSAWVVDTSDASVANWKATLVTNLTGCRAPLTALLIGQDVIFLSVFGVTTLGALSQTNSISEQTTISAPVRNHIDRINPATAGASWAVMWRDVYLLAIPVDGATVPNLILPFNTVSKRWGTPWSCTLPAQGDIPFDGFSAAVLTNFGEQPETLISDSCGRVLRFDVGATKDSINADETQEIVSWFTTKGFTHDSVSAWKQPFFLEIDWFNSTGANVQVNLVRDGVNTYPDKSLANSEIIATGIATNALKTFPIKFPFTLEATKAYSRSFVIRDHPRYRNAGVQIVSQQGAMKVRAIRLHAFLDTPTLT